MEKMQSKMTQPESEGPRRYKHPEYPEEDTIPFFPNYVILEVIVSFLVLAALIVLASLLPVGLEEKADPFSTPQHIKPEWYFLWIYQFIKVPSSRHRPGCVGRTGGHLYPGHWHPAVDPSALSGPQTGAPSAQAQTGHGHHRADRGRSLSRCRSGAGTVREERAMRIIRVIPVLVVARRACCWPRPRPTASRCCRSQRCPTR